MAKKIQENSIAFQERSSWFKREETSHMKLGSILLIGYRNISMNRTRSILTIGGVSVGVGIITFLIALGFGVQDMVIKEVTKNNPENVIDISNENLENFVVLNEETAGRIKNIDGISAVEIRANIGGKFINGESQTDSVVYGVTPGFMEKANSNLERINISDFASSNGVVVTPRLAALLGYENAQDSVGNEVEYQAVIPKDIRKEEAASNENTENEENNPDSDSNNETKNIEKKVGDENELISKKIKIVGIINDASKADAIYAYATFQMLKDQYGIVAGQSGKVEINDMEKISNARSQIEQIGFVTESVIDIVNDINSFFTIVRSVLVAFGTIIMSISAMGMMNTLSVSLLQRTKEVGILKALGAKRTDIFKMFIFEAILISFSGGILGVLGGYGAAKGINLLVNTLGQRYGINPTNFVYVPMSFLIAIATFIILLGLTTGVFPARRASKIHALEALRYE